jgi:betaine-aldehyde dehydrogenase
VVVGAPGDQATIRIVNPATGAAVGHVPVQSADEVAAAVEVAAAAQRRWSALDFRERAAVVRAWGRAVEERVEELARLESTDAGLPIAVARSDIMRAVARMNYFADLAWEMKGQVYPARPDALLYSIRQPYGVIGVITPYNHPALFALSKVAAPLIAGNSVVVKPPEQAPRTTEALAELWPAGAPTDVVRVVTGDRSTGEALVGHPLIRKLSFTGSVPTGRAIMRAASLRIVPAVLELGGKNAVVVLPDAPLADAVRGVVGGMALAVCGQSCQSGTRLFVHESMHDDFVAQLVPALTSVRIGDPLDEQTEMGPLITSDQRSRVLEFIDGAVEQGAEVLAGGGTPVLAPPLDGGFFIEPTVLDRVRGGMRVAQEEVFGPVLSVITWSDERKMLEEVNALEFGLTASVWSQSLAAQRVATQIEAGYVYINQHGGTSEGAPFGGWKQSGIGTEHSIEELHEFTRVKTVDAVLPASGFAGR